jgi:hypothetical protein
MIKFKQLITALECPMRGCKHVTENMQKSRSMSYALCRNPNLTKCGGEAQHLEKLGIWSPPGLPNVQSSTVRGKTPRIGVFLVSLERY